MESKLMQGRQSRTTCDGRRCTTEGSAGRLRLIDGTRLDHGILESSSLLLCSHPFLTTARVVVFFRKISSSLHPHSFAICAHLVLLFPSISPYFSRCRTTLSTSGSRSNAVFVPLFVRLSLLTHNTYSNLFLTSTCITCIVPFGLIFRSVTYVSSCISDTAAARTFSLYLPGLPFRTTPSAKTELKDRSWIASVSLAQ